MKVHTSPHYFVVLQYQAFLEMKMMNLSVLFLLDLNRIIDRRIFDAPDCRCSTDHLCFPQSCFPNEVVLIE